MLEGQVGLPDGRLLEVRVDDVDVGRRLRADRARLRVRVGAEDRRGAGRGRAAAGKDLRGEAGVGVRVGQPDVGRRALEQAEAAAQLGRAVAVEGVVEAEARLQQFLAVDGDAVVVAEAAGLATVRGRAEDGGGVGGGVVQRRLVDVRRVEAQASQPIINPIEMGWDTAAGGITALIARLQANAGLSFEVSP